MQNQISVLLLIALGAGVGGFLARRLRMDKVRVLCAVAAIVGAIGIVARSSGTVQGWIGLGIAVTLLSTLLISGLRHWRPAA